MNRRHFLKSTAALFVAPAIVHAENLMRIQVPPGAGEIWEGTDWLTVEKIKQAKVLMDSKELPTDMRDMRDVWANQAGEVIAEKTDFHLFQELCGYCETSLSNGS